MHMDTVYHFPSGSVLQLAWDVVALDAVIDLDKLLLVCRLFVATLAGPWGHKPTKPVS